MPGVMSWNDMNWLFPDFRDTGLIYHGTIAENLATIFREGLRPGPATDDHDTIYNALYRHRPPSVPDWVDPRRCIFGGMNRRRFPANHRGAIIGIQGVDSIRRRTWFALSQFSDWLYCPREAGYFDTEARTAYYKEVVEPVCARAYWDMSLSFERNLSIRHDELLTTQGFHELLICLERIDAEHLSLQAVTTPGPDPVLRKTCPGLFHEAETRLKRGQPASEQIKGIEQQSLRAGS